MSVQFGVFFLYKKHFVDQAFKFPTTFLQYSELFSEVFVLLIVRMMSKSSKRHSKLLSLIFIPKCLPKASVITLSSQSFFIVIKAMIFPCILECFPFARTQ